MLALLLLAGTYFVAAIPFGLLIGRLAGVDVRRVGSGNIGATNVLRATGRGAAAATLLLDGLKGAAPVVIARLVPGAPPRLAVACAVVAVLGHCYPVYLRFRGGKGVATAAGALLALSPWAFALAVAAFAAVVGTTRLVSAASCAAAFAFPAAAWGLGEERAALGAAGVALLIVWRHRENLRRIAAGTEPRLGERAPRGGER